MVKPSGTSAFFFLRADWFFCAILAAAAFFPNLFLGRAYFDGDLNVTYEIYQAFLRDNIFHGHFPLWNPYLYGGIPFAADPCAMAFYPPLYLALLFPLPLGFGVFYFIHSLLALGGMHRWLKTLGFSPAACRLGAAAFGFSGYFWWEIIHPNLLAAFVWLPWVFGALENLVQKPKPSAAAAVGFFFTLMFLAGHSQVALGALYGGPIYFLFRIFTTDNPWRPMVRGIKGRIKAAGLGIWMILALLPTLALFIPEYEFIALTDRFDRAKDYLNYNGLLSMDPARVWQFLFPVSFINSATGSVGTVDDYLSNAGTLGVWAPFFILAAFFSRGRKLFFFILSLGVVSFLTALGAHFPLHRWLCGWAPGFSLFRAPFRYIYLYDLFLPLLIAMGWDRLAARGSRKEESAWGWAALLYAAVLGSLCFLLLPWRSQGAELLSLLAGGLFLGPWVIGKKWGRTFLIPLLALGMILSGWVCGTSRLGPGSNFDFKKNLPDLGRLGEKVGHNRILFGDGIPYPVRSMGGPPSYLEFPTNAALALGLRNSVGDDISLLKEKRLLGLPFHVYAGLLAVQGYISGAGADWLPGFERDPSYPFKAYFSKKPPDFLFSPRRAVFFNDEDEELRFMAQGGFDPAKAVGFSGPLLTPARPASDQDLGPALFQYQWVKDAPDEESFDLQLNRDHWVVFSEVNYPGWKAWIDGSPVPVETADTLLRALWVKAGAHRVEFRFEPAWTLWIFLGLAFWIFAAAGLLFLRKKSTTLGIFKF